MINSHLLYRLSYRGTTVRMLLIQKGKSILLSAKRRCGGRLRSGVLFWLKGLDHLSYGACNSIEVVAVQRCDADAAGTYGVDSELVLQAFNLLGCQA